MVGREDMPHTKRALKGSRVACLTTFVAIKTHLDSRNSAEQMAGRLEASTDASSVNKRVVGTQGARERDESRDIKYYLI